MRNPQAVTLRQLAGAPTQPPTPETSALVVIDAQEEYGPEGMLPLGGLGPALQNIERLESLFRKKDRPVVHVAHVGRSGGPFDPELGGRFIAITGPESGEATVSKRLPNSFAGTDLHQVLTTKKVANLVLVGFMTHMCLSSTARAALDLGYSTTVVSDAASTRDLPTAEGNGIVPAADLHQAALAALADRFSIITCAADVLGSAGGQRLANQTN